MGTDIRVDIHPPYYDSKLFTPHRAPSQDLLALENPFLQNTPDNSFISHINKYMESRKVVLRDLFAEKKRRCRIENGLWTQQAKEGGMN